jgi:hypothetical protein
VIQKVSLRTVGFKKPARQAMFSRNNLICLLLIILFSAAGCSFERMRVTANEDQQPENFIRLVLNRRTSSFSLYYLVDPQAMRYEPLFNNQNPAASSLAVNVNGRVHRLGQSRAFRTNIERRDEHPALVFQSPFLIVEQVFSPVSTPGSSHTNGVMITINIHNVSESQSSVGLRFIIDTILSEGRGRGSFIVGDRTVTRETLFTGETGERYWVSRGQRVSLMGNIAAPAGYNIIAPDFVHMANWDRLYGASWRLRYSQRRSFNPRGDSAVCYYYEPLTLESGASVTYTIFLTTEDTAWY